MSDELKGARIIGEYMGGHPQHPRKSVGVMTLHLTTYGVVLKGMKNRVIDLPKDEILDVHVEADPSAAKRSVGAKAALGVFALATSRKLKECYLVVNSTNGDLILHVKKPPMAIQGQVAPYAVLFANERGIPTGQGPAVPALSAALDITDEIRKLGALRDAGVLTEDEFAAKKTELLARL